jgi:hypothetical protein
MLVLLRPELTSLFEHNASLGRDTVRSAQDRPVR